MKNFPLPVVVIAALLAGCVATPITAGSASSPPSAAPTAAATAAVPGEPYSLPFAQLLGTADYFARGESEKAVLTSSEELEAFLNRHPAGSIKSRDDLRHFDFLKHRVVAYIEGQPEPQEMARITRVVEQPEVLLVHTSRWTYGDALKSLPAESRPAVHFIGLPRDGKPIAFASTDRVVLPVSNAEPSPMPGVPGLQTQLVIPIPVWRAVPNPEVTKESIAAQVQLELKGSTIASLSIEKVTVAALTKQLGSTSFRNIPHSPESEVWFVKATGALKSWISGVGGEPMTTDEVIEVLSIETGTMFFGGGRVSAGHAGPQFAASALP